MKRDKSFGASATSGMMWMSISVLFTKATLFVMQIVLGFILNPADYAVFAVVSVALTFVAGLQNAGASKMLIQRQEQYQSMVKDYTDFALYMGLIGALVLMVLGLIFGQFYRNPELVYVIGLSALSVPITSLISIQFSRLSIDLRFRQLCLIDFGVAVVNAAVVITAALLGARYYSIALGLVVSTLLRYLLNRQVTKTVAASFKLSTGRFLTIFGQVKWLIVTAFLTGLAQQGDYFVLGRVITPESLGFYYFGFQLTANIGQLLAQGVGSTLFPIFTAMKNDLRALRSAVLRSSSMIHFACSVLCLGFVGLGPWLIHLVWRGKWDMAIVTAVAIALTLPMRMLSPMAAVTLDSFGKWRQRTALLLLDSTTMMAAALIGAHLGDLQGASIAVALQRLVSGLVDFSFAVHALGGRTLDIVLFGVRAFMPFWVIAAALTYLQIVQPATGGALHVGIDYAGRTLIAIALFSGIAFTADRQIPRELRLLLTRLLSQRGVAASA